MNDQRGFTLIEALIAFAILAVSLTILLQAAGTSLRAIDAAAQHNRAVLVAQSQLDRIVALKRMPDAREGAVPNTPFQWRIEEIPNEKAGAGAQGLTSVRPVHVRLSVSWAGQHSRQTVAIDRLIFVPRRVA